MLPSHLLPDTARVSPDDHLQVGGCDLLHLAATYGTPLFVYDEAHLRARCQQALAAFGAGNVIYATKAFLCTAMARVAWEEGLLLDVATGGELYVALHAGVPGGACVLHGNNKSTAELRDAIAAGVRHVVVDSFDELDRLEALGMPARVQLRITPGVHAHTHAFVQTGQDDSKFGFNLRNGDATRAVQRAVGIPSLTLIGLHGHVGSNVFDAGNLRRAAEAIAAFAAPFGLPELTLGGGLGVAYVTGEQAPDMAAWAEALAGVAPAGTRVLVEPGRAIVASAALTLYTIGTIKQIPGVRTYVAVDGGMSDNPRPVLYGSGYEAFLPGRVSAPAEQTVRVVGKHCESGDVLVASALLPVDAHVGEVLATPVTGAYGHAMASNYNKVPRPAVVFVRDGAARVVVRRETYGDLVRLDEG